MFQWLDEPAGLVDHRRTLVAKHGVKGFHVHDVRYVAAMQC